MKEWYVLYGFLYDYDWKRFSHVAQKGSKYCRRPSGRSDGRQGRKPR